MNLVQRASSLIFPGFWFGVTDTRDAEKLVDLSIGGFCLYGGTRDEVFELVQRLQARARNPLLFCADYEDGTGAWIPDGTRFPSNMAIAAAGNPAFAREKGEITAIESRALGVDWVLAPVVDLATRPENPIVNLRAYGVDPDTVIRFAEAYIDGLVAKGALPSVKHFPGHGETTSDSHLVLPDLEVPLDTLLKREMKPFLALKEKAGTVMVAHLRVKAVDAERPATLSKAVGQLLRGKAGFTGVISTDALSMNAISDSYPDDEQALLALNAQAEVLLVPKDPFSFQRALLRVVNSKPELEPLIMKASEHLIDVKKALGLFETRGKLDRKGLEVVGAKAHQDAADKMARAALAWARSENRPTLKKGDAVAYLEPENDPEDWQGSVFVEALRDAGVTVDAYQPGKKASALLLGVFSRPQAYSGKIGLNEDEMAKAAEAIGGAGRAGIVSFGTPFAVRAFDKAIPALCTFSAIDASQRAAAEVLLGTLEAKGTIPVQL